MADVDEVTAGLMEGEGEGNGEKPADPGQLEGAAKPASPQPGSERFEEIYKSFKTFESKFQESEKEKEALKNLLEEAKAFNQQLAEAVERSSSAIESVASKIEDGGGDDTGKIESRIAELRTEKKQAMRDVDYDAVDRIDDELMELKLQLKATQAAKVSKGRDYTDDGEASKREKIHPAVVKFTKENEWFSGDNYDPEMKAYAIMLDNTLQGDPKWMARSIDERLAEVKMRVEKRFDYNKNPKRTGASAVDGGDLGRGSKMKVDLSSTELELARGLGIPEDVFAKQKQFTKKMKGGR